MNKDSSAADSEEEVEVSKGRDNVFSSRSVIRTYEKHLRSESFSEEIKAVSKKKNIVDPFKEFCEA